jgi:hypothetical protein
MSSPAAASPAKSKKAEKKVTKKPAEHPKYVEMVEAAIGALKERTGSSRQAIAKYINANYKVNVEKSGTHIKLALKKAVAGGVLKQVKGTGASGSFKIAEKPKPAKKPAKKPAAKKPVAKKATKATPKKAAKKPAAKKATPKKAKKPTPKKAKKPAAKKPAAKKPVKKVVKKKAAKKTAKK